MQAYPSNQRSESFQFPTVIDNTMRCDFVSCPTKFYYSFIRKLGPPYASTDLIAGAAFARGLEIVRKEFYGLETPLEQALQLGCHAAIEAYGDHTPIPKKENKSCERVLTALYAYFNHFNPSLDHIQPYFPQPGKPAVEWTFSIPLPIDHPETGDPIIYAGRFDMLGVYNGQLICVDEKTTSQLGSTWRAQWDLRSQFTGYTWAAKSFGLPVIGCVARGVSFLKETKQNPLGHGFEESIQLRPQWMIDAWYEQLLKDIERMILAYKSGWFDQDFSSACADYSGCVFKQLCTVQNPNDWIEGHYLPRDWNPLAKLPYEQPKEAETEVIQDAALQDFLTKTHGQF